MGSLETSMAAQMDQATARKALADAIEALQANAAEISAAKAESEASEDPMAKMMFMGKVTQLLQPALAKYGMPNVMMAVMQITPFAQSDADIKAGTDMVQAAMKGSIPADSDIASIVAKLRA